MNAKKITLSTIAATLLGLASLSSHAATIFSQDFEAGLGANETSAGGFVLNTMGNAINGSTMMGHATAYSNSSNAYSFGESCRSTPRQRARRACVSTRSSPRSSSAAPSSRGRRASARTRASSSSSAKGLTR